MAFTLASSIMGCIFAGLSLASLAVNLLVIIAILYSRMMQSRSSVYIFSFVIILNDLSLIFLHLFYFAPSCFLQDFLFAENFVDKGRKVLDFVHVICWYYGTLSHIVIAIDRFISIVFYKRAIFTSSRVVMIVIIQVFTSAGLSFTTQFLFPCCRITFTYSVYTYTYVETPPVRNYSNLFDLPLNSFASLTTLVVYSTMGAE